MSNQRSQQDMDNEWRPNGRPQSTMARNFSASLNSAFAIDEPTTTSNNPQLDSLTESVSQKKAALDSQNSELQALEARIKEMDKRLEQKRSRTSSPARKTTSGTVTSAGVGEKGPHLKQQLGNTFSGVGGGGERNVPGAAGNFHGADIAGTGEAAEIPPQKTSSPMVDRTMKTPDGVQNLSANS